MARPKKSETIMDEQTTITEEETPPKKRGRKAAEKPTALVDRTPGTIGPNGATRMYVRIFYIEPILGTSPADPEIARRFVASKAPDALSMEDEVASIGVDAVTERSMTIFSRDGENADGCPIHWDYQWKGHEKDAWSMLKKVKGSVSSSITAGKKMIDKGIFPGPRRIPIVFDGKIGICERPLRANTPKGERVSLAISEQIPAGAHSDMYFDTLVADDMDFVREVLNYGRFSGMGQWRNSGKGRFLWQELDGPDGNIIGGNFAEDYPGGYEEFKKEFPAFTI